MTHSKILVWPLVLSITVLSGAAVVGAEDTKKPAAVSASTTSSAAGGATTNAKPAAVQASSAKATVATHLEIVDFSVNLKDASDSAGIYKRAQNLAEVRVTVKGRGIETEIAGSAPTGPGDAANYDGLTAFQILVEQGYFVHKDGVGFILTRKGEQMLGIGDDSGPVGGQGQGGTTKGGFLGTDAKLNISPTTESTDMVDPGKPQSVAEDPSQKGGLFGYTLDGPIDTYNPNDPNTPEGKKKLLRDQLSELSRACWDSPEGTGYLSCNDGCTDLLWSEYGRVSQDKVDECRRNCKAVFEQNKPGVCHDADAVEAQLDQLGDE